MNGRVWLWTLGGIVVYVLLAVVSNAVVPLIYKALTFIPPIDTAEPFGRAAIPLALVYLLLNIFGEELWWLARLYTASAGIAVGPLYLARSRYPLGMVSCIQVVDDPSFDDRLSGGAFCRPKDAKHVSGYRIASARQRPGHWNYDCPASDEMMYILSLKDQCRSNEKARAADDPLWIHLASQSPER
jgi:hypothetical protein